MTEPENTESNDNRPTEAPPQFVDFGARLKQAREAAGYSIAEVSDELKLGSELIEALESSAPEDLPAATFTQGYLRNYARLLKLPSDEIVQAYNRQVPVVEPDLAPTSGIPAQKNSADAIVKITSYGLLIIGLLLVVLWWQQSGFEWLEQGGDDRQQPPVVEQFQAPENEALRQAMGEQGEADLIVDPGMQDADDAQPEIVPDAATDDITEPVEMKPAAPPPASPETELPEMPAGPSSSRSGDDITEPEVLAVAAPGDDEIFISTRSESWTEINDANNNRLLFKLMQAGQDYRIQGQAPFTLFLGNAPSVDIRVNGQAVDISAYIRSNNIANLMIHGDGKLAASRKIMAAPTEASESVSTDEPDNDSSRDLMFDEGR